MNNTEYKSVSFSKKFEEKSNELQNILGEKFELLEKLKAIYDWAVLADILQGEQYISYAKVKTYEIHQDDLKWLKQFVNLHCPEKKSEIFRKTLGWIYAVRQVRSSRSHEYGHFLYFECTGTFCLCKAAYL